MGDRLFSEYNAVWTGVRMRLHGRVFVDVGFQAMRALTNLPLCDPVGYHCV